MSAETAKLVEQLKNEFDTIFSDISDYEFEQIAVFIKKLVLEARIDEIANLPVTEIGHYHLIGIPAGYHARRYDNLKSQLDALNREG